MNLISSKGQWRPTHHLAKIIPQSLMPERNETMALMDACLVMVGGYLLTHMGAVNLVGGLLGAAVVGVKNIVMTMFTTPTEEDPPNVTGKHLLADCMAQYADDDLPQCVDAFSNCYGFSWTDSMELCEEILCRQSVVYDVEGCAEHR